MKTCKACKKEKPISDYYKSRVGTPDCTCKACRNKKNKSMRQGSTKKRKNPEIENNVFNKAITLMKPGSLAHTIN